MKTTTRNTLIASIGLALGFIGSLGPVIGLPEWTLVFYAAFPNRALAYCVAAATRKEARGS